MTWSDKLQEFQAELYANIIDVVDIADELGIHYPYNN